MKLHKPGVLTLTATAAIGALLITSCSSPTGTDSSGNNDGLVLADGYELGGYNPVAGFGAAGEAKMYDGLVRLTGGTGMPGFEPSLAAEMPTANADATVWTVKLRDGVTFSDGSTFDAADVVATYKAILDPASASEARSSYDMISDVVAVDDSTVEFRLAYSYAPLLTKMLIGMVPSESLATPGLAAESPLNTAPVGTGPYTLADLSPDRAVFEANENYWDGAPEIKKLTLLYVPDDNTRAQRMVSGEIDGTNLPPLLANTFSGKDNMSVTAHQSADWRGLSLPTNNPVAGDKAVRMALNLAADRQSMIDNVLGGHGRVAATPIPESTAIRTTRTQPSPTTRPRPSEFSPKRAGSKVPTESVRKTVSGRSSRSCTTPSTPFDVISLRHLPPMLSLSASRWNSKRSPGTA